MRAIDFSHKIISNRSLFEVKIQLENTQLEPFHNAMQELENTQLEPLNSQ